MPTILTPGTKFKCNRIKGWLLFAFKFTAKSSSLFIRLHLNLTELIHLASTSLKNDLMHYAVVHRLVIENRTWGSAELHWGSEAHISEQWHPNIIRKCDNDRESYDDRKCDRESYRVPKKKVAPEKKVFGHFLLLDGSIWTETMLYDQGISLRRSGYPTCLYLEKNWPQAPWGPKKGQKGPFGALDVKIRMYGCEATEIAVVLAPTYLW